MRAGVVGFIKWLQALASALQFLTRLPIPVQTSGSEEEFRKSTLFFPTAGLLIGAIVALAGYLLEGVFSPFVNAVLALGLWIFLSGGLHLDGLMDTADGLLSHRSRERMLEIMKDSRVGAMGVIVCVLYLLLKTALLETLLGGSTRQFFALLTIPVWSRAYMVTAIAGWRYAREGHGLGLLFRSVSGRHAVGAAIVAVFLSAAAIGLSGWWRSWTETAVCITSMAGLTYILGWLLSATVSRKLGGLTGDVYGALNEMIELGLLLALVGYLNQVG